MGRKVVCFLVLALCIGCFIASGFAEEKEDLRFKWGSYLRARHEFWRNWKDMDNDQLDNRNFFRFKTSLWGQMDYEDNLSLFAKLTNEFKPYAYYAPSSAKNTGKTDKGYHFDISEFVVDNLYLDIKNFIDLPVDIRFGRQDFLGTYGEGFLIMDGTPQDGSRTFYFNALKTTWRVNEKNNLDFIYILDPRDDTFLPVLNEDKAPTALNTTNEEGYVLYWKNKSVKDLALENYYIYKREDDDGGTGIQGQKGIINTFGSYGKYNLSPFTLRGQLAYQFGDYGNNDRTGLGGYIFVDEEFKDKTFSPKASIGYLYLSGDDRDSGKNEAWNPLFSRWPWMSELYVMSIASDSNVGVLGYWTNLSMWRAELVLKLTEKAKLSLWYNFLRANELVNANAVCSGLGKNRGHLPQLRIDYAINKNVSTYFLAEYLIPGNFYKDRDEALFTRVELQLKF